MCACASPSADQEVHEVSVRLRPGVVPERTTERLAGSVLALAAEAEAVADALEGVEARQLRQIADPLRQAGLAGAARAAGALAGAVAPAVVGAAGRQLRPGAAGRFGAVLERAAGSE